MNIEQHKINFIKYIGKHIQKNSDSHNVKAYGKNLHITNVNT